MNDKLKMTGVPTEGEHFLAALSKRVAERADKELAEKLDGIFRPLLDLVDGRWPIIGIDPTKVDHIQPGDWLRADQFVAELRRELFRRNQQSNREAAFDLFMRKSAMDHDGLLKWAKMRAQEMLDSGEAKAAGDDTINECKRVLAL